MKTGNINIYDFRLNTNPNSLNKFAVRLTRNIVNFLTETYITAGVLPAMIATADAFGNEELAIGQYLNCLYEILPGAVVI